MGKSLTNSVKIKISFLFRYLRIKFANLSFYQDKYFLVVASILSAIWDFIISYPKAFHLSLVFVLTLIVVGFLSITQVDPHHDGIMLKPAIDVANGKMIFRDTFAQYGALTTLIQSFTLKLFGEYLIVIRLLTALFYGVILTLLWLIYSRILSKWLTTFSCIICLSLGYFLIDHPAMLVFPWATVFSISSILFSLYFLILFLEKQNYSLLFITGAFSALTFWFKINYGIISFSFMFLLLITLNIFNEKKDAFKNLLVFSLGFFIINTIFVVWLVINGALEDFLLQSVKFAFAFSSSNLFSSNDPFVVKIIKSLFQIGSTHGYISFIWTVFPLIALSVLILSTANLLIRKNIPLSDKITFSISFVSVGLWFGYYPLNALFHMYLSSISSIGLFIYFFWKLIEKMTIVPEKNSIKIRVSLIIIIILSILSYDLYLRKNNVDSKMAKINGYEKIKTPKFLKGMYVPLKEKKVYEEIERVINKFPNYNLINLTNSGLFSLYKDNNNEFHKMYIDWGWNNSYLYPDYITKLSERILLKSDIIFSSDNFMIEGYVPIKVFPILNGIGEIAQRTIMLIPGKPENVFEMSTPYYSNKNFYSVQLNLTPSKEPITIDSIVVKIFTENDIPKEINKYEFDYNVIPRILNKEEQIFLRKLYVLDERTNQYLLNKEMLDRNLMHGLLDVFSNIFLYEKFFHIADTFKNSENEKVNIYLNNDVVNYKTIVFSNADVIDLLIPTTGISENHIVKLRINYDENLYHEEIFKNFKL